MEAASNCEKMKEIVKETYSGIVENPKEVTIESICGVAGSTCGVDSSIFAEDYSKMDGYCKDADMGLGCGIPTNEVSIKEGDYVLDLGCGAGNDCFVARRMVGEKGKVIGLDFLPKMLQKAWKNLDKMKYNNIEFRLGDIEDMPISDNIIDIVTSNCVINLVPNKKKAYEEIFRVLKPNGIFTISDTVITKELPAELRKEINLYACGVSGAMVKEQYVELITNCGFDVEIRKEKEIKFPKEMFLKFISEEEYNAMIKEEFKVLSITVLGKKIEKKSIVKKVGCCCEGNNQC